MYLYKYTYIVLHGARSCEFWAANMLNCPLLHIASAMARLKDRKLGKELGTNRESSTRVTRTRSY